MNLIKVIKQNVEERRSQFILLIITGVLILTTGIIFKTPFVNLLPLFISLFIMLYMSEANRYAFLAGGVNSLIYSWVYFSLGIYASAASAAFFSFPMQMITFFNWKKRAYKKSVIFKKMSAKLRVFSVLFFIAVWCIVFFLLKQTDTSYAFLDNTAMLLGISVTLLTPFAYIEYAYIGLISTLVTLCLKVQLVVNNISNLPFLISTLYNVTCYVRIFINVRRLYKEQNSQKATESKGEAVV